MPVQDYKINTRDSKVGQEYGLGHASFILTGIAEGAGVEVGRAVNRGTGDHQVVLGGPEVYGIVVLQQKEEADLRPSNDGQTSYSAGDLCAIMVEGFVNVEVKGAVTAGGNVFVDDVTGEFYGSAGAGLTQAASLVFEKAGVTGDIVPVRIK